MTMWPEMEVETMKHEIMELMWRQGMTAAVTAMRVMAAKMTMTLTAAETAMTLRIKLNWIMNSSLQLKNSLITNF